MNNTASIRTLTYISLSTVIIIICSWISIPAPVPFTLQTLAVFTVLGLLGGKKGTAAILMYILTGAIGVPVFSGFRGGPGILLGVTGGYIIGFIFIGLIYWLFTALFGNRLCVSVISYITGILLCYSFGTIWYICVYTGAEKSTDIISVLSLCVFPFIIPDILKIVLAGFLLTRLRKLNLHPE